MCVSNWRPAGTARFCVDSLENGYASAVRSGLLEQLDVCDEAGLDDVFRRHQPAAGMHFTAYIQVGDSVQKPLGYHRHAL